MADSGIFRINPLQAWQREAILKAAQLLRERFGNPPTDPQARNGGRPARLRPRAANLGLYRLQMTRRRAAPYARSQEQTLSPRLRRS